MNSLICIYDYQTCYDVLEKPLMNDLRILCWVENDPTYLAEKNKWQYQFQANTYRHRRVISLFYLGCRVIKKKIEIAWEQIIDVILESEITINLINFSEEYI